MHWAPEKNNDNHKVESTKNKRQKHLLPAKKTMGYYLVQFAAWLREDRTLPTELDIVSDRAVLPENRKQKMKTRWDHLARQNSFSLPRAPARRGSLIGSSNPEPPAPRMLKQSSFSVRGSGRCFWGDLSDEFGGPPRMVKQTSFAWRPDHTTLGKEATRQAESMTMPRLSKQRSFTERSNRRRPGCSDLASDSMTLPTRRQQYRRAHSSDDLTLSPRKMKQRRNFSTDDLQLSPLKSDSRFSAIPTMPARFMDRAPKTPCLSNRTVDRKENEVVSSEPSVSVTLTETNPTALPQMPRRAPSDSGDANMPRLVKQTSFTVRTLSPNALLLDDEETEGTRPLSPMRKLATLDETDAPRQGSERSLSGNCASDNASADQSEKDDSTPSQTTTAPRMPRRRMSTLGSSPVSAESEPTRHSVDAPDLSQTKDTEATGTVLSPTKQSFMARNQHTRAASPEVVESFHRRRDSVFVL